jgi:thiol-disulfide isomerase/thioredoxin
MIVLVAAVVLLTVVTAVHLLLTFALIRRVRELQENGAKAPAMDDGVPGVGMRIGDFTTELLDGRTFATADLAGGDTLVGFFAAGCGPCKPVVADLVENPPAERFVAFVDAGDGEEGAALIAKLEAVAEVAAMPWDSPVAGAFAHQGFPTLVRVSDGVVADAGHTRASLRELTVR